MAEEEEDMVEEEEDAVVVEEAVGVVVDVAEDFHQPKKVSKPFREIKLLLTRAFLYVKEIEFIVNI